jgi:hypothetical protein
VVALIPRFLFIMFAPESIGDGQVYETVAENILSGCGVSLSILGSGECVPHFGGNQGPGYPAFIAFFWWISGHSNLAVHLAQAILYVAALIYLVDAVRLYSSSTKLALLAGLVLALSPLQVAWPRYIFTETLALAGTLWLFAELLRSLHESKLRLIPIGLALAVSTFVRLDAILLVVPVAVTGFIIHRPLDAIRRGIVIALILGLPWGGWMLRNIDVGLTHLMPQSLDRSAAIEGYSHWGRTWQINQYQFAAMIWPIKGANYDKIRIADHAYISKEEKEKAQALLDELKKYTGKPFPKHINDQFEILANEAIEKAPIRYYLLNPVWRIWELWSNIYDSFAWPIGLGGKISAQDRLDIESGGLSSKFILLRNYPVQVLGKIFVNGWRFALYFLFIFSILIAYKDKKSQNRNITTLALSFIIARSVLSATINYVETRYTLMQIPVIELVVVLVVAKFLIERKNTESYA